MADYGELAENFKLQQEESAGAAEVAQKQRQAMAVYFQSVQDNITKEIAKANAELEKKGILSGALAAGVTTEADPAGAGVTLRFGPNRFCNVQFSSEDYDMDVSLEEIEGQVGLAINDETSFSVSFEGDAALAFRETEEEDPAADPGGLTAEQMAEFLVSSVIRGRLE